MQKEEMGIGKRIRQKREELGMSLQDVATKLDVNKTSVMRWEKGETGKIKLPVVEKLAQVLSTTPEYLMGWESSVQEISPYRPGHKIPILGRISAGLPLYAQEQIEGYTVTDLNGGDEYFALRVTGDSMNAARINDGDLLIVKKQEAVDNGDIAIVSVDGESATVKRFFRTDHTVTLMPQSFNPVHQMQVYDLRNTDIRIIGKVVKVEFTV